MFERTDSGYLESLPDEEFFSRRFTLSKEDQKTIDENSFLIDGRVFYKAAVKEAILKKYAAATNPKPGEPGSPQKPLIRFGREYVYNETGDLSEYVRETVRYALRQDMKPTEFQKRMAYQASRMPIAYSADCPELSEQTLNAIARGGERRNRERERALGGSKNP